MKGYPQWLMKNGAETANGRGLGEVRRLGAGYFCKHSPGSESIVRTAGASSGFRDFQLDMRFGPILPANNHSMKAINEERAMPTPSRYAWFSSMPSLLAPAVFGLCLLCGCGSPNVVRPKAGTALADQLKSGRTVCVLEPKLTYETMGNEQPTDGSNMGADRVKSDLVRVASDAIVAKGHKVQSPGEAPIASELSAESEELLRTVKSAAVLEKLAALGKSMSVDAVMVQCFKVKVGPGGSWDPNSGAITAAMNSGHLRVAILDAQSGQPLWQNSVYMREIPRVESKNYRTAIDSLYQEQKKTKQP
jgi:hypothetical protein